MTDQSRRFFSGNSLAQAVMAAARFHLIEPEALAYRVHEKRHGFVRHARNVVIEVDPEAPRRAAGAAPARVTAAPPRASTPPSPSIPAPAALRAEAPPRPAPTAERRRPAAERAPRAPMAGAPEAWDAPDAESEAAAAEASRRLLQLSGLEIAVSIRVVEERFEVVLSGADESAVAERGLEFLEELEHLLPRAIHGLCGRMVRCRVDCGGVRAAHDENLRRLARREAERAVASGEAVLLDPLSSAERRVVHLELLGHPGVTTESLGTGARKRVQISPVPGR